MLIIYHNKSCVKRGKGLHCRLYSLKMYLISYFLESFAENVFQKSCPVHTIKQWGNGIPIIGILSLSISSLIQVPEKSVKQWNNKIKCVKIQIEYCLTSL